MFSVLRLLFYFLLIEAVKGIIDETTSDYACSIPNEHALNPGFVGKWFCYDINDESSYQSAEYMQYGYLQSEPYHIQDGITDITVSTPIPPSLNGSTDEENQSESESEGSNYLNKRSTEVYESAYGDYFFGFNTTYTNLTIELSGLYLAPQDGDYQFEFTSYDNSAVMFFGAYDTQLCPSCAQDPEPVMLLKREYLDDNYQTSIPFFLSCIDMQCSPDYPGTVKLMAGQYYPIIIVYTNAHLQGSLGLQVTMPDGTTTQDFSSSVFNYYEGDTDICEDSNSELYSSEFLTKTMSSETEDTPRYTSTGTPSSSTETLGTGTNVPSTITDASSVSTDVSSTSTDVSSTSTEASSAGTEILGADTNVLSTSTDASSTSTDVSSTSTDASSVSTDVSSTSTDFSSTSTDVSSTSTDVSSTSTEASSAGTEILGADTNVLSTSTDASSTSTDVSSTSTDASSVSTDASSVSTDVSSTSTDFSSTSTDVSSTSIDVSSTSTEASSAGTEILGADTNVLSTSTDASGTSTDVSSTSIDVSSTSTDASSVSTDVSSTSTDVSSTSTDVSSTSTDASSVSTDVSSTSTDVSSTSIDVSSTSTEASSAGTEILGADTNVLSTSTDASGTSTDVSSTSIDVSSTSTDASSVSTDVSSTSTDVSSTSTDVSSTSIDVSSTSTEASSAGTEILGADTNVLRTSTDASSISTDFSSTSTEASSTSTEASSAGTEILGADTNVLSTSAGVSSTSIDVSSAGTETTKTSYVSTAGPIANSANDLLSSTASPSSSKNDSFSNALTGHPSILSIPLTRSVIPSLSALSSFDSHSIDHTSAKPRYSSHRTSSSSSTILVPDAYTITLANEFETYFEIVSFVLTTGSDGLASIGTLTYDLETSSSSSFGLSTQKSKSNTEVITSKYQTKTDSLSVTNTFDDTVFATSDFNTQYPHETISASSVRDTVIISSTLYSNTSGTPTSVSEKTAMTNLISSGFRPVSTSTSVSDLSTSFSASKATSFVFPSSTVFVHSTHQPSVSNTYVFEHNPSSSRSYAFSKGSGHLEASTLSKILSTARVAAESKLSRSPIEISLSSEVLGSSEVFTPSSKSNFAASTPAFKEPIADSTTLLSNTSTPSEKPDGIDGGKTLLPSITYIEIMSTSDNTHESQLTKSKSSYSSAQGLQKTVLTDDLSSYNGENSLATYTISKGLNTNDTKYVSCPDNTGPKPEPSTPMSSLNPTFSTKIQSDDITSNLFEQVTMNNSAPIICSKCFSRESSSISNKITSAYYMASGHTPNTSRVSAAIITVISCDDNSCNKFEAQKSIETMPTRSLPDRFQPHAVTSTSLSTSVLKSAVHSSFSQNSTSNQSSISSNIAVSTVGPESCVESICSNFYDSTILESSNVLALDTTSHMTTSFRSTNTSNSVTHAVSTNTFTTSTASLFVNIAPSNLPSFTTCYIFVLWVYWNL